ncbi:DUF2470 domain-containing protein [Streptomyces spectabilis]|uniref:DUF2470 domain-containing protein n=1 Tax=Streptomyces spectabilis TaxID=68270 RepID=A0A5P2XHP7_STRST|nr:DUF2470 domain-containing protein [Streptomyces spectabilis]MBB5102295.1 hypothetical protein [Streptomyces spectabilis]MCI3907343.1 DUF2470 domain-containing protein [Streptomyces spectabilis]QEV64071.1 DUF2470 domain-containing protein [Streptomyces spectabilis]GGV29951.1 hypothetical protein GCM10010245_48690 [Streptomyces spectabilis]
MGVRHISTTMPAAAARARSVLATAWSCAVTTEIGRDELLGAHSVSERGAVRLDPPEDSALAAALICAPRGEPSTLVEFADVSPVPVRDRVRSRLWLSGSLTATRDELVFEPTAVVLHDTHGRTGVDLEEFALADPDPLAHAESRLLTHLADSHPDAVEQLTRLIAAESLSGVVNVKPFAIDRHGLTLRLERVSSQADVRLPFHAPVEDLGQVTECMHALLTKARLLRRPALRPAPPES